MNSYLASFLTGVSIFFSGLFVVSNAFFFLVLIVLCTCVCVDVMIGLIYQTVIPPSVGAAFGCCLLASISYPYLGASLACLLDWSRWPVKYSRTKKSFLFVFGVPPESNHDNDQEGDEQSSTPAKINAEGEGGVSADYSALSEPPSASSLPSSASAAAQQDQQQQEEEKQKQFQSIASPQVTQATIEEAEKAQKYMHYRRIFWYTLPTIIWITSTGIGFRAGKKANSGTWSFLTLSFFYAFINALINVVGFEFWRSENSAFLYILTGPNRSIFPLTAISFSFCTLCSVVSSDKSMIAGGTGAIAVSYLLLIAFFAMHLYVKKSAHFQGYDSSSKPWIILAIVELCCLLISGISIAASFSGKDSAGVFVFLVAVLIVHAMLYFSETKISAAQFQDLASKIYGRKSISDETTTSGNKGNNKVDEQQMKSQSNLKNASDGSGSGSGGESSLNKPDSSEGGGGGGGGNLSQPLVEKCSDATFSMDSTAAGSGGNINSSSPNVHFHATGASSAAVGGGSGIEERQKAIGVDDEDPARDEKIGQRTKVYRVALAVFIVTCFFVFAASCINTGGDNSPAVCGPNKFPGFNGTLAPQRFTICDVKFRGNLSILDYAALVAASYFDEANFEKSLKIYFPGRNVTQIGKQSKKVFSFIGVKFFTVRFNDANVSVVLTRGSTRNLDWLQDVYLASTAFTLQLGTALFPLTFSDSVAATLVDILSSLKFGVANYVNPILDETRRVQKKYPQDYVVNAAHSLGAHIAELAASITATKAVVFSPFSISMQYKRYDFSLTVAQRVITAVCPVGDLVPKVGGKQVGNIQWITQLDPCGPKNAMCHSIKATFAALATNCGDPLGRVVVPSGTLPKC